MIWEIQLPQGPLDVKVPTLPPSDGLICYSPLTIKTGPQNGVVQDCINKELETSHVVSTSSSTLMYRVMPHTDSTTLPPQTPARKTHTQNLKHQDTYNANSNPTDTHPTSNTAGTHTHTHSTLNTRHTCKRKRIFKRFYSLCFTKCTKGGCEQKAGSLIRFVFLISFQPDCMVFSLLWSFRRGC